MNDYEIENLAQNIRNLQGKDKTNAKIKLCNEIFLHEFKSDKYDFLLFADAFEEIVKNYPNTNETSFKDQVIGRYNLKRRGKQSERLEAENSAESKLRAQNIRKALREAALNNGMESKDITKALSNFNMLNKKRAHEFLTEYCNYSEDELAKFDDDVFNNRYTVQFDAHATEDDNTLNKAEIETAKEDFMDFLEYTAFDKVLDETRKYAVEQGKKFPDRMRGFWTIRFIESEISELRAKEKEIHIMLTFYLENKQFYDNNKYLMEKMSAALSLAYNSWYREYLKIHQYVWKIINDLHMFRSAK